MLADIHILVVDDEPQIQRALQVALEGRGFEVSVATNAEQALQGFVARTPDLLLVNLMLPGMDGLELSRRIRSISTVPIIVASSEGEEQKKLAALEQGADDYVNKPFGVPELLSRIRSLTQHLAGRRPGALFECGELSVSFDRREVRRNGELVHLTPKEYELLKYMIDHGGRVRTQKTLLLAVWGEAYVGQVQFLRIFVGQLRKKIEADPARPRYILTESGVGYRFCLEPML
ncbi:MAG: response regulator [Myxococcota bacterium]